MSTKMWLNKKMVTKGSKDIQKSNIRATSSCSREIIA